MGGGYTTSAVKDQPIGDTELLTHIRHGGGDDPADRRGGAARLCPPHHALQRGLHLLEQLSGPLTARMVAKINGSLRTFTYGTQVTE